MRIAFINDNKVIKIEEHELMTTVLDAHLFQKTLNITDIVPAPQVGWLEDKNILNADIASVTPRQIRQALILSGYSLEALETTLNTIPEPTRSLALVEWEYSTLFIRSNAFVKSLGPMLGFTSDQLDQLWILAAKL